MNTDVLKIIKSKGYWRINFEPVVYGEKIKKLGECKDIVEKNIVELRGWDYPHYPRRTGKDAGLDPGSNFYQGWIDWYDHKELWRMYQSAQFLHYFALRDDWMELAHWGIVPDAAKESKNTLNIIGEVVYEMTEVFEFLSRLTRTGIYDEGVRVSISLNKTKDRELVVMDAMRAPLMGAYKAAVDKIEFVREYKKEELLDQSKEFAFGVILYIFERFGWDNPPLGTIKHDQENLLSGKA
ncbi:MAG: hypothetical protein ABSE18_04155 [Minisyncoccia bacterium]|jgi:hypothetical protein